MASVGGAHLDLQQAADALGVHYQTAYRWVRSGQLAAKLVGGQYVVTRDDLDALERSRRTPRTPPQPSKKRLDRAAERMYEALLGGDEQGARKVASRLVEDGTPMTDLIQEVLVPPLCRIGEQWHCGELTVWAEHRASAIVERLLGEFAPNPRGRRRGTAVVAALSGDHHALPTMMAAAALRDDNWHVQHFGADLPPDEVVQYCDGHGVTVAVLTVTNLAVRQLAETTAERLRANDTSTIVGGPGRTLDELVGLAREIGAAAR